LVGSLAPDCTFTRWFGSPTKASECSIFWRVRPIAFAQWLRLDVVGFESAQGGEFLSPTTTEIGDELRDHVIHLLEARGHPVQREVRIDIKKVDILVEFEDEFTRRKIAIECKNYSRSLSQDEISHIHHDHRALIDRKDIDGLWIIARKDFSPEAKGWAAAQANLNIFTIAEFEERQFGFRRFVRKIVELFSEQELDEYYVEQHVGGELLSDRIRTWIDSDDKRPVAILGGYGMGKTSFCKFLVAELGRLYLADASNRVPIYIRLSEISKEQDLDGLLGKTLASRYRLTNYNYNDIMSLNARGKFVFIFDGFDEMKHALTWDVFKFNFSQINLAVQGDSKIIVAGRPNAFLSDDEHIWALRGTRIAGERQIKLTDWPEYHEIDIEPFSQAEARLFLRRYLEHDLKKTGRNLDSDAVAWIGNRIAEFESLDHKDDFARPVHLRIFADLAKNRDLVLRDFGVYELYEISTQQTFGREMEKVERLPISEEQRRRFIQDVAWWLWESHGGRTLQFNPNSLPLGILRRVVSLEQESSDEGIRRELFSGAFIERKLGETFYFAHRSFLEFFVAQKLEHSSTDKLPLAVINEAVNEAVLSFLKSGPRFGAFVEYVILSMNRFAGELKLLLVQEVNRYILAGDRDRGALINQQHVELIFKALPLYKSDDDNEVTQVLVSLIADDLATKDKSGGGLDRSHQAFYLILDALLFAFPNSRFGESLNDVLRFLALQIDFKRLRKLRTGDMPKLRLSRENIFEFVFLRSCSVAAELGPSREPRIIVDFGRMFNEVHEYRRPKITITNRVLPIELNKFVLTVSATDLPLSDAEVKMLVEGIRTS
jgi:hypothetical protein